ncbi:MAG: dockerin type I domain-containing protein, partial [Oscillospiraceae bacterium]
LNYDGRVMADDLVLLRKGILMQRQEYLKPESDVNYDGKTDILDLIALKKYYSYRK